MEAVAVRPAAMTPSGPVDATLDHGASGMADCAMRAACATRRSDPVSAAGPSLVRWPVAVVAATGDTRPGFEGPALGRLHLLFRVLRN